MYDQLAFSNKPTLYISAPDTTDKSGASLYALTSNNLSPQGQPIIYRNNSSFLMNSSNTVSVTGNPLFFNEDTAFECVIVATRPTEPVPVLLDDDQLNGLYIIESAIQLKLFFESYSSIYSKTIEIPVKNWDTKFYINVVISNGQATLVVNGESLSILYTDNVVSSTNLVIGGGYGSYFYLIDGIGFYNKATLNKYAYIDDPGQSHTYYSAVKHLGQTTKFDGYSTGYIQQYGLKDFIYDDGVYTLIYYVTGVEEGLDYVMIKCNDENITVEYDIDLDDSGEFKQYLMVNSVTDSTIRFTVQAVDVDASLQLTIEGVYDSSILNTPANLVLTGMALYSPGKESIVNYTDGTRLDGSTYTGTWIDSSPKSIEIVFKAIDITEDTIIFYSDDGHATYGPTGSIAGYTAYLNNVLVTDLDDVRPNQWNHLVLTIAAPTATTFYLNSDDGLTTTTDISYMLLSAYPEQLVIGEITVLYNILSGLYKISQSDTASIIEGEFDNGLPFNYYSFAWAIVGAGGS